MALNFNFFESEQNKENDKNILESDGFLNSLKTPKTSIHFLQSLFS